jgi:phospholipid-translocating ATPase
MACELNIKYCYVKVRRSEVTRVQEAVKAVALCHNVTPVYEETGTRTECKKEDQGPGDCDESPGSVESQTEADQHYWQPRKETCVYQASSPDEVSGIAEMMIISISFWVKRVTLLTLIGQLIKSIVLRLCKSMCFLVSDRHVLGWEFQ